MIGSVVYLHYFIETCMWGYIFTSVIICFMVLWEEKKSMPRIIQINIKALTQLVLQWCGFSKSKKLPQLFGMSRRNNECKCCWWWQSLKFCKWKMTHPFVNSSPLQKEPVNAFVKWHWWLWKSEKKVPEQLLCSWQTLSLYGSTLSGCQDDGDDNKNHLTTFDVWSVSKNKVSVWQRDGDVEWTGQWRADHGD